MTLSHCWGGLSPITLTRDNIEKLHENIPWERLPRTFKDAIGVAKSLNAQYLWIDALCIIQDSESDWAIEASRMTSVYANSYLNIAADASENANGGLFRDRHRTRLRPFIIPKENGRGKQDNEDDSKLVQGYCCFSDDWILDVESAALNRRAWVVQERFLAPRVVHFAEDQVYWECPSWMTSEVLPFDVNLNYTLTSRLKDLPSAPVTNEQMNGYRRNIMDSWWGLVIKYTSCSLTNDSDKPVAIAGLARAFCYLLQLQPADYACGLWRPTFVHELDWICINSVSMSLNANPEPSRPSSPSWSWLSAHTSVSYRVDFSRTAVAELLDVETTPIEDPFGSVSSAYARIRAPLCLVSLNEPLAGQNIIAESGKTLSDVVVYLDTNETPLESQDEPVYLLLLTVKGDFFAMDGDKESAWSWGTRDEKALLGNTYARCECLILKPCGPHGTFRRIGVMMFSNYGFSSQSPFVRFWNFLEQRFCDDDVPAHLYESVDDNFFYTITLV